MEKNTERDGFYIDLKDAPDVANGIRMFAAEHRMKLKHVAIEAFREYLNSRKKPEDSQTQS